MTVLLRSIAGNLCQVQHLTFNIREGKFTLCGFWAVVALRQREEPLQVRFEVGGLATYLSGVCLLPPSTLMLALALKLI